jgi:hypothetical protein
MDMADLLSDVQPKSVAIRHKKASFPAQKLLSELALNSPFALQKNPLESLSYGQRFTPGLAKSGNEYDFHLFLIWNLVNKNLYFCQALGATGRIHFGKRVKLTGVIFPAKMTR